MKPISRVILDLRGLVLHSYYAGNPVDQIRDEKGDLRPTAVHGMDRFIALYLLPILQEVPPVNVIGALEGVKSKVRRQALYADYKSAPSQDDDSPIVTAEKDKLMTAVQKLMLGLGCMLVKTQFAEADDTIAYLCERLHGGKIVHTVDNDLLQLMKLPNVGVLVKGKYVESYKGVPLAPYNLVALYKSICGDSSDGYVGVRGIGEKKWMELYQQFGADGMAQLEDCVRHGNYDPLVQAIQETSSQTLEKLYKARDEWSHSYKLAILHPEWCEMSFQERVVAPEWAKRVPSEKRVSDVLEPMGLMHHYENFKRFMPRMWLYDKPYQLQHKIDPLLKAMKESRFVAFDYESYDKLKHQDYQEAKSGYVDVLNQVITGCSFCFGSNFQYSFYMPTKHRDTRNVLPDDVKAMLLSMVDADQILVAHNSMFEQTLTYTNFNGMRLPRILDTVIMSSYVNENISAGLKYLSKHWLNYDQTTYNQVVKHGEDMRDVSGEEVLAYGCDDSITSAHLTVLFNTILECEQTWDFYEQNEPFFEQMMLRSFVRGVPLDYTKLDELRQEDDKLYTETYTKLRGLLEENCSKINEDGFARLWAEIEPFERAKLEEKGRKRIDTAKDRLTEKGITEDDSVWMSEINTLAEQNDVEMLKELQKKKDKLWQASRYHPIVAPIMTTIKKDVATIAKSLSLPTIRSIKPEWLNTYCTGIYDQVANGAEITQAQQLFVDALKAGATLDINALDALESWMQNYADTHEELWSGDLLNAGSPDQMAQLFYGKMGLPVQLRNISKYGTDRRSLFSLEGAPSTNENAIRTWMIEMQKDDWRYLVLDCILTIRGVRTRRSLYYKPYPLWKSPVDGRTHPQIRNCGTVTRRPSGTSYNILQVSKTKDQGKIRSVYLPQNENELIVSIDFVQQELVIVAGESGDHALRSCYVGAERKDVHTLTGWRIYNSYNRSNVSYEEFDRLVQSGDKLASEVRKKYAKNTNFLEVYGGSAKGMARKIMVPLAMAEQFDASFHAAYPRIKEYQDRCIAFARRYGYSRTCFGGRRHLPDIFNKNKRKSAAAERQSGNYPIQGGAAEVLKKAARGYVINNIEEKYNITLYGAIYDELVASVPKEHIFDYVNDMANIMEMELPGLNIGLRTSVSIGKNWGEQHEVGERPTREVVEAAIKQLEKQP